MLSGTDSIVRTSARGRGGAGGEGVRVGYTRVEEGLIEENPGSVLQNPIRHPFRFLDEFSAIFRVLALFIGEYTARVGVLSVS